MSRRVVVTGVGVVSSIGVGVDGFWNALADGVSGASVLELEGEPPTPVCRVEDFDGEALFGRRDSRRMDRCAQLATAAAQLALADAGDLGLRARARGREHRLGPRRHRHARRGLPNLLRAWLGSRQPVPDSARADQHGLRRGRAHAAAARPVVVDLHRLRRRCGRNRRRALADPLGPRRRDARGRLRLGDLAGGARGLPQPGCARDAASRRRGRQPSLRLRARRVRDRRGLRRARARGARARARARGAHLCRAGRLRLELRRLASDRSRRDRRRPRHGDDRRARGRGPRRRRTSATSARTRPRRPRATRPRRVRSSAPGWRTPPSRPPSRCTATRSAAPAASRPPPRCCRSCAASCRRRSTSSSPTTAAASIT